MATRDKERVFCEGRGVSVEEVTFLSLTERTLQSVADLDPDVRSSGRVIGRPSARPDFWIGIPHLTSSLHSEGG